MPFLHLLDLSLEMAGCLYPSKGLSLGVGQFFCLLLKLVILLLLGTSHDSLAFSNEYIEHGMDSHHGKLQLHVTVDLRSSLKRLVFIEKALKDFLHESCCRFFNLGDLVTHGCGLADFHLKGCFVFLRVGLDLINHNLVFVLNMLLTVSA